MRSGFRALLRLLDLRRVCTNKENAPKQAFLAPGGQPLPEHSMCNDSLLSLLCVCALFSALRIEAKKRSLPSTARTSPVGNCAARRQRTNRAVGAASVDDKGKSPSRRRPVNSSTLQRGHRHLHREEFGDCRVEVEVMSQGLQLRHLPHGRYEYSLRQLSASRRSSAWAIVAPSTSARSRQSMLVKAGEMQKFGFRFSSTALRRQEEDRQCDFSQGDAQRRNHPREGRGRQGATGGALGGEGRWDR